MKIADFDNDTLEDVVVVVKPDSILFIRRLDTTGLMWDEYQIPMPDNTGAAKAVAIGDIDRDGRNDIVFTCENADGKYGAGWLSFEEYLTAAEYIHHDISGDALGIKYDRIELLDLDGDGALDMLTCEERQNSRGLGVIWYENPLDTP